MKVIVKYIKKYKKEFITLLLLTVFISGITNILPLVSQAVFEKGIISSDIKMVLFFSVTTAGLYVLKGMLTFKYEVKIAMTANELVMLEKNNIFNQIINQPLAFFDKHSPQYILSRINEVNNISSLLSPSVFNCVTSIFSAVFALAFITYKNVFLGLICIPSIFILYKVTGVYMGQMGTNSKKLYEQSAKTNDNIHRAIQGLFTIKNLNREESVQEEIRKDIKELSKKNIKQQRIISKGTQIATTTIFAIDAILIGGIAILVVCKKLDLVDYISLSQYISLIFAPITMLQSLRLITKPAVVALERIENMLNEEPQIEKSGEIEISQIESIEIKNLKFSYDAKQEYILKNLNLSLKIGDKLELVGDNGSGKTTLIKVLLGYYGGIKNSIFINNNEMEKINKTSLRKCVGLIPQNIFLFEATVYENIRVANSYMESHEFDNKLQEVQKCGILQGMDLQKVIIDNGKNLSKGQIQQIAIARVLVGKYSLYIFDEATSYLDKVAKEAILNYIKEKMKNEICIFVCHDNEFKEIVNKKYRLGEENENIRM